MTFINKLGTFTFHEDIPLVLAKLIRDTITGQWFNPKPGEPLLTSVQSCYNYILSSDSRVLSVIPFKLTIGV